MARDGKVTPINKPRAPRKARGAVAGRLLNDKAVIAAREATALDMFLRGHSQQHIAEILGATQATISLMITRGLAARSDPAIAQQAREIMAARLELMLSRWMPLALGEDGHALSDKAAEICFKALDRLGAIHGVHVHQANPVNVIVTMENIRAEILRSLDEVAERAELVAGTLERDDTA